MFKIKQIKIRITHNALYKRISKEFQKKLIQLNALSNYQANSNH